MLSHYLKLAVRTLLRHKLFSAINLLGLSAGLTFAMVIGLFVLQQYSINKSLRNSDRQYIVKSKWKEKDMGLEFTTIPALPKALKDEYPRLVANYYRYNPVTNVVSGGDKHFKEDIAIGDTTLVSMYGFQILYGNKNRAFIDNSSAVITETMAEKLFGNENPLNKTISILGTQGNEQIYKVSAVLKDIPFNSVTHLIGSTYNVFVPTEGNTYYGGGDPSVSWDNAYQVGMIEMQPGVSATSLNEPVQQLLKKHAPPLMQQNLQVEFAAIGNYYLNDNSGAAYRMILILSVAAAFILFMAIINFVNIYIGVTAGRLKEIGLRKVFGGRKKQLRIQFVSEAILMALVSAIISLIIYQMLRPAFSDLLSAPLPGIFDISFPALMLISAIVLLTGLSAGVYPAWILSGSRVSNAVQGKFENVGGSTLLRKTMLTVQFSLAIIVFVCAVIVASQVNYIFQKDTGYTKDQVLVITAFPKQWDSAGVNRMLTIRDALKQVTAVKDVSLSFEVPDRQPPGSARLAIAGTNQNLLVPSCAVDEQFGTTYGLQLLSGSFMRNGGYISDQIVLNESAVNGLGMTAATAVNRQLKIIDGSPTPRIVTVAGVVKDFHYSTMHERVGPLAFFHVRDATAYRYLSVKLNGGNIPEAVNHIRTKWKELLPGAPFEYNFMDDRFAALYQSDLRLKKASSLSTVLSLIIVLLGIFGVVSFTLVKRTKEIAVRRVLGASIQNVVMLFGREYALIMLIANIIAWPVAYLLMNRWLEDFAYRVEISLISFVMVAIGVALVSAVLIAAQSSRAALTTSVKALRSE